MTTLSRSLKSPPPLSCMLNLAIRTLARALNMPEPLLHSTGAFVVAQVQATEARTAKTLCPIRLLRRLLSFRGAANGSARSAAR
jgi:hypothetical protein